MLVSIVTVSTSVNCLHGSPTVSWWAQDLWETLADSMDYILILLRLFGFFLDELYTI